MIIKDRYTKPMELPDFVVTKLDSCEHGEGMMESVANKTSNTLAAFGRLLEVLHKKKVITLAEVGRIVSGGDLGIEAVERDTDARGK
jgi:hypothetical protein